MEAGKRANSSRLRVVVVVVRGAAVVVDRSCVRLAFRTVP
jgi:hypothetical protein